MKDSALLTIIVVEYKLPPGIERCLEAFTS